MELKNRGISLRFLEYLKPHILIFLFAAFLGVLRFSIPLLTPWVFKFIIDDILLSPVTSKSYIKLYWVLGGLGLLFAFWGVLNFFRLYMNGIAGNKTIFDLRHNLFCHLQKMSPSFFEKKKMGDIVSRITQDISKAEDLVGYLVTTTLIELSSILVIGGLLFYLHPKLALVSLSVIPFYAFVSYMFSSRIRRIGKKLQEKVSNISSNVYERFSAHSIVLSFVQEAYEEEKFKANALAYYETSNQNFKIQAIGISLTSWLSLIAPLLVIGYGSVCVLNQSLSMGALVAFYSYVAYLFSPVTRLTELSVVIAGSYSALDRIFEMLDTSPEIEDTPAVISPHFCLGHIKFENVYFDYNFKEALPGRLISDLNFEIMPGEYVVLMGKSGAGKSTIAKLLLQFLDHYEGEISIDGLTIKDWKLATLRQNIGFVSQEPTLFSGTIKENILYGNASAHSRDVVFYSKLACAHDFISQLPEGYETLVVERGANLSIGQKQRIAIARSLIKEPSVLILDEPTSNLDAAIASQVEANIRDLRRGKTTLLITHSSRLAAQADRIFCLENGRLVAPQGIWQQGSELLKSS